MHCPDSSFVDARGAGPLNETYPSAHGQVRLAVPSVPCISLLIRFPTVRFSPSFRLPAIVQAYAVVELSQTGFADITARATYTMCPSNPTHNDADPPLEINSYQITVLSESLPSACCSPFLFKPLGLSPL
eukprot:1498201-Rhodomonas_salina.1